MMNEWIISSSVLIGLVLLGRFLLRGKISLRLQYGLWAVVLLRLLLPVQIFTSDFGTGSIAREVDISAPVRQVYVSANEDRYEREYDAAYRQVVAEYEAAQRDPVQVAPVVIERAAQERAQRNMELDLEQLLYHIWFGGMVVVASVIITCNVHLSIQLKRRRWELEVADSLLPVYITEAVPTPCIFGIYHPAIYLTPDAAKDPQVRAHVLEHELTHYRHWDHVWSVLRSLCLVLHWYNPLVWIAAKVSRADAELACDEGALARLGEEARGDYGRTLIGLTCSAPISDLLLTATTMTGSAGSLRERIKLLMKRPRNTVLTLTAVILLVTIIVGCTFSGAPETTAPTETTEPTGHVPEDDMSYQDQDLPIPENHTFINADGLLVYPGTEWGMTEYEVLKVLHFPEYGTFSGMRGIHLTDAEFCGYPADIAFYFDRYLDTDEWGLCDVRVQLANEEDANAVYNILYAQLRESDFTTSGVTSFIWRSNVKLTDLVSPNAYAVYQESNEENILTGDAASTITWFGAGTQGMENSIWFSSGLSMARQIEAAIAPDQVAQVRALFDEGGDPWYLAALAAPYADQYSFDAAAFFSAGQSAVALTDAEKALITQNYGKDALAHTVFRMSVGRMEQVLQTYIGTDTSFLDMSAFLFCPETDSYLLVRAEVPQLRAPEILFCDQLANNQVRMIYQFPGEEQRYCATLLKGENWKVYSNHILIEKPLNARDLTEDQVAMVRTAFSPDIYDAAANASYANPLACFTHSMYDDISEMTKFDLLWYFPSTEAGSKEELALLIEKYPDYFEGWTTETMPLPVHRYDAGALDEFMMEYAGIRFRDLPDGRWAHYLEETDSYYHYASDFGLMGFACTGGWVYDGGAVVYSNDSALYLTERDGKYYIQAHIPAIVVQHSSSPMIPAELSDEDAVKAVAEAFLTAYGENIYLNKDNEYDHLTVLAADSDAVAFRSNGQSAPMLDFRNNIQNVHKTEDYWKQARQEQGITRNNFEAECHFDSITFDADLATVTVGYAVSFTYDDQPGTTSGLRDDYRLQLVRVDGTWLIAEAAEIGA